MLCSTCHSCQTSNLVECFLFFAGVYRCGCLCLWVCLQLRRGSFGVVYSLCIFSINQASDLTANMPPNSSAPPLPTHVNISASVWWWNEHRARQKEGGRTATKTESFCLFPTTSPRPWSDVSVGQLPGQLCARGGPQSQMACQEVVAEVDRLSHCHPLSSPVSPVQLEALWPSAFSHRLVWIWLVRQHLWGPERNAPDTWVYGQQSTSEWAVKTRAISKIQRNDSWLLLKFSSMAIKMAWDFAVSGCVCSDRKCSGED